MLIRSPILHTEDWKHRRSIRYEADLKSSQMVLTSAVCVWQVAKMQEICTDLVIPENVTDDTHVHKFGFEPSPMRLCRAVGH